MRNGLVVTVALMLSSWNCVAQNLVPNPSFEDYIQCPWSLGAFNYCLPEWYDANGLGASYFNSCGNDDTLIVDTLTLVSLFGVPWNHVGFQPARTGDGYAELALWVNAAVTGLANMRNYIGVKLIEPLQADTLYCVSFYLSMCGDHWSGCSVNSVGMLLSHDSINDGQYDTLSYVPQIQSDPDSILSDTVNWMLVSGTYQAQGGEQYITIGNFKPDNQTTVVNLDDNAVYFIDDVTVERCSQVGVSANALVVDEKSIEVFPNPASGEVTVRRLPDKEVALQIVDAFGRVLKTVTLEANKQPIVVDVSALPDGIYIVSCLDRTGEMMRQAKLVVLH